MLSPRGSVAAAVSAEFYALGGKSRRIRLIHAQTTPSAPNMKKISTKKPHTARERVGMVGNEQVRERVNGSVKSRQKNSLEVTSVAATQIRAPSAWASAGGGVPLYGCHG